MIPRAELVSMFRPLHMDAFALAEGTFSLSIPAAHPCGYLVRDAYYHPELAAPQQWPSSWRTLWQLPEPFIGNIDTTTPLVVFVGINPSIDHSEPCPRVHVDLETWLDFWTTGFNDAGRLRFAIQPVPLYEYYQTLLATAVGPEARLGSEGIVTEAVRYKARTPRGNGPGGNQRLRGAIAHSTSLPLTLDFLRRSGAKVVVAVGQDAMRAVGGALVGALQRSTVSQENGNIYNIGFAKLVISLHTNGRPSVARRLRVAQAIAECLGRPRPTTW